MQTQERSFVLKVSALEIYNETVVDLLNRDTGPLRLLDDSEVCKGSEALYWMLKEASFILAWLRMLSTLQKGTIVENLVEEVVESRQHLQRLIGICEGKSFLSKYHFCSQFSVHTPWQSNTN